MSSSSCSYAKCGFVPVFQAAYPTSDLQQGCKDRLISAITIDFTQNMYQHVLLKSALRESWPLTLSSSGQMCLRRYEMVMDKDKDKKTQLSPSGCLR